MRPVRRAAGRCVHGVAPVSARLTVWDGREVLEILAIDNQTGRIKSITQAVSAESRETVFGRFAGVVSNKLRPRGNAILIFNTIID